MPSPVGEAMVKFYQRSSNKMMNPKLIQRVGQVLALPGVIEINRLLGFGNPQKRKAFTGRYYGAVRDWLNFRESNPTMLDGLKKAGYAKTVRSLARMVGYKPQSQHFFEVLGWKQKQSASGHRRLDDRQGSTILDRLPRIHEFGFAVDLAPCCLTRGAQPDERCVPDCLLQIFDDTHAPVSLTPI